jgi:hypothetical protein
VAAVRINKPSNTLKNSGDMREAIDNERELRND